MIGYELWDIETRNLLYDFDSLEEALEAARELSHENQGRYPDGLALAYIDANAKLTWLAHSASMLELLERRPAV